MLKLCDVTKTYHAKSGDVEALKGLSISFRDSEFVAVLGASGCGKTTLLNIIGGLDRYSAGDIEIDGISTRNFSDADWDSYRNHSIGFVFQSYNLINHQSVLANVEMSLMLSGVPKAERTERAQEVLTRVGLADQVHKKPLELSGGQMQRVAIARALVNNPSIILADEPTGALDSKTSVQVMDLLEEISKDHLVIMVTHNPELAQEYATRVVRLKDGEIVSDSNPPTELDYEPNTEYKLSDGANAEQGLSDGVSAEQKPNNELRTERKVRPKRAYFKHTHLGFFSALGLSFNNLLTKKGRTLLTAFAGAIGIIGIALILSLSNGMQDYINTVESDTMGSYPITIQQQNVDMQTALTEAHTEAQSQQDEYVKNSEQSSTPDHITTKNKVAKSVKDAAELVHTNDLGAFETYIKNNQAAINPYVSAIEYGYQVSPEVYDYEDAAHPVQVSPVQLFGDTQASMMGGNTATSISSQWTQLPTSSSLRENRYDLLAGNWPTAADEVALVLDEEGTISDYLLYTLGVLSREEMDQLVDDIQAGKDVEDPVHEIAFDDVLGRSYTVFSPAQLYKKEGNTWILQSKDTAFMQDMQSKGQTVHISAILQAKTSIGTSGVVYTNALTDALMQTVEAQPIVQQQLNNPKVNVFTGQEFKTDAASSAAEAYSAVQQSMSLLSGASLATTDTHSLMPAPLAGGSATLLRVDTNGESVTINLPSGMTAEQAQAIIDAAGPDMSAQKYQALITLLQQGAASVESLQALGVDTRMLSAQILSSLTPEQFLATLSQEQKEAIAANLLQEIVPADLVALLGEDELAQIIQLYIQTVSADQLLVMLTPQQLAQLQQALMANVDQDALVQQYLSQQDMSQLATDYFSTLSSDQIAEMMGEQSLDEDQIQSLIARMSQAVPQTYTAVLTSLGYATPQNPTSISLYPKDFDAKEDIAQFISTYNARTSDESEQISYTDLVGLMTNSVRDVISMITLALLAFVAISLVVSSIMIAIITYISVLERTKEIGILRSLGASKGAVSRIFTAETFIEGLLSGIIGVGVAALLDIPISTYIEQTQGVANIAVLTPFNALVLIAIAVILTLIAGFVPSLLAAKKDPVVALRSE